MLLEHRSPGFTLTFQRPGQESRWALLEASPERPHFKPDTGPGAPMKFKNVVIQSLAAIDPPIRVTSKEIEQKLQPTLERLGIRDDLLEEVSGIGARRFWKKGTQPSDAATLAAEKALDEAGIDRGKIGVIINTSV